MDPYYNSEYQDPGSNCILLVRHGIREHLASYYYPSLRDGNWHTLELTCDNGSAVVRLDGSQILSADMPVEFAQGYFMFSAATGASRDEHWIDDMNLQIAGGYTISNVTALQMSSPSELVRIVYDLPNDLPPQVISILANSNSGTTWTYQSTTLRVMLDQVSLPVPEN